MRQTQLEFYIEAYELEHEQLKKAYLSKCVKWCKKNNLPLNEIYA